MDSTTAVVDAPVLGGATLAILRSELRGSLICPEDVAYDAARRLWNGMVNRRPAAIARCADAVDVAAAVRFARTHDLVLAVRGGGHSFPGLSTCDGGLVIDLSRLKRVNVDPDARIAWVDAGVLLGELDAATQAHGLAVPAGQVSHTGVAGLTLGGGTGWLMRKHGLTIDNLLAVEIVTADGQLLRADADEHPDLYWAVRGGGGNFGVVTRFCFRLHPVGPLVLAGPVVYPLDQAAAALHHYREVMERAPDELTVFAVLFTVPPAPPFPAHLRGRCVLAIDVCYSGPIADGEQAVASLRSFGSPVIDLIGPMPYVVRQSLIDEIVRHGLHYFEKAHNLHSLDDAAIGVLVAGAERMTSPLNQVIVGRFGGAIARVADDATAYPHRDAAYMCLVVASWQPDESPERHTTWARALWSDLLPASTGGVYVNILGDEGGGRVRAAYGGNYDRLVAVKNRYDPTNLFRRNQNIVPTV